MMKWYLLILFLVMMFTMVKGTEAGWWNNSFAYYYNVTLSDPVNVSRIMDIGNYCINHTARNMALPYNDSIRILSGNTNNVNYVIYNITYVNQRMSYYCVDFIFNKTADVNGLLNFSVYYSQNSQGIDNFISAPTMHNVTLSASSKAIKIDNNFLNLNITYAGGEHRITHTYHTESGSLAGGTAWKNISGALHFDAGDDLAKVNCINSTDTLYAIFQCRNSILDYNLTYKIPTLTDYYFIDVINTTGSLSTMHTFQPSIPRVKYGNSTSNYTNVTDQTQNQFGVQWVAYANSTNNNDNIAFWIIPNISTTNGTTGYHNLFRVDLAGQNYAGFPQISSTDPLMSYGKLYKGISNLGGIWEQQLRNLTLQFNQPIAISIGLQQSQGYDLIINSPNGTTNSVTVPYSVNFSSINGINTCTYNVTTSAYVAKVSPTSVDCNNFSITSGSFIVSGDGNYIFFASMVRATDSLLISQQTAFTVSTSSPGTPGGGGGGGGSTLFAIGLACTQDIECSSGICDTASKKCVTTLCGNNICDPNESQNSCQEDCSLANINASELLKNPFFLGVFIIIVIAVFVLSVKTNENQKKRQRRV